MAMNREQKRAMQKAGQLDDEGAPATKRERRAPNPAQASQRTSVKTFIKEVRSELKKVVWPTREELIRYSLIVLFAIVFFTVLVSVLDFGFLKLMRDFIFNNGQIVLAPLLGQ